MLPGDGHLAERLRLRGGRQTIDEAASDIKAGTGRDRARARDDRVATRGVSIALAAGRPTTRRGPPATNAPSRSTGL